MQRDTWWTVSLGMFMFSIGMLFGIGMVANVAAQAQTTQFGFDNTPAWVGMVKTVRLGVIGLAALSAFTWMSADAGLLGEPNE